MITVRWITGNQDRTFTRDENFNTRAEALKAISAQRISTIRRLGRMYCATVKAASAK